MGGKQISVSLVRVHRRPAPQFVEEIQQEYQMIARLLGGFSRHQRDNRFAVRGRIITSRRTETDDLARPDPRLLRQKRITVRSVRRRHQLAVMAKPPKEQILAVARPRRVAAAVRRHLALAALMRKRLNIYLVSAGLVGHVREPSPVR